jgi:hypothetical protein
MANKKDDQPKRRLRTVEDIQSAYEDVFFKQENGLTDNKTVDAMNTTLKGVTYLGVKLRMDAQKMLLQAAIKKVDLPFENWPAGLVKIEHVEEK